MSINTSLTYSIIIPHKNIPKLLQRCLDSIPQRSDLEVIVVDDNSDQEIVDFEHFPGQERSDITVIFDKSGKGAGRARNIGLSHAKGKWLLFADADDFFTYCLNDVLDEYVDCEKDIVFFKACSVDSEYYTNSNRADNFNQYIELFQKEEASGSPLLRYGFGPPWSKLIRHEIVDENEIVFQETKIHNDTKFSYLIGYYATKIDVDSRALYCVTYRKESVSWTITDDKIIDRAKVLAEMKRFYIDNNLPEELAYWWWFTDELIRLKEQGKISVYNKCLEIFSGYGFPNNVIEKWLSDEIQKKKKARKMAEINKWVGRAGRILRHLLRLFI